jgi:hypothetical protein
VARAILRDDPGLNPKSLKWSGLQDVNLRRPLQTLKMIFWKEGVRTGRGLPRREV